MGATAGREGGQGGGGKCRCIILADSNGREATGDSIKNHIPRGERGNYDIDVVATYTTDEAFQRVDRGVLDVNRAIVVIDSLTNEARNTRMRRAVSPEELVRRVDRLRRRLKAAGAAGVVVCQLKPMQVADVTPYNNLLSDYLRTQGPGGYGCRTQIRLSYLRPDGYHVEPQYDSIIDRTYACALRGVPVPRPTPFNEFVPDHVRCRWEAEWPRVGLMPDHGWKW